MTALFYAWYLMSVKRLRDRGAATLALMAATTTVTALLLLPVAAASGEELLPGSAAGWLTLAGLAWVSHSGGQGLIAFALAHLPAAFDGTRTWCRFARALSIAAKFFSTIAFPFLA